MRGTLLCLSLFLLFASEVLGDQLGTFQVMAFGGTNEPGAYAGGGLVLGPDGNYYGAAQNGGAFANGAIFRLTPDGTMSAVASFPRGHGHLLKPLTVGSDGSLYGVTGDPSYLVPGPQYAIFRVTLDGKITILADLPNPSRSEGLDLSRLLQASDGYLYGTTIHSIFRMTHSGELTTLVSLDDPNFTPRTGLIEGLDGYLYGTAAGTVFRLSLAGDLTTVANLSGGVAGELLLAPDGNFYCLTGNKFVQKITPGGSATQLATLSFTNSDSDVQPSALITGDDGNFYGVMGWYYYRVTPAGQVTPLATFSTASNTKGYGLSGNLLKLGDGSFLTTALHGGRGRAGIILQLAISGSSNPLASFPQILASNFATELIEGIDHQLYGVGANATFGISKDGVATPGTDLVYGYDYPSRLLQLPDGSFYGCIGEGGIFGEPGSSPYYYPFGFNYYMPSIHSFSYEVHQFNYDPSSNINLDGYIPLAGLTRGPNGDLYGTALAGGANGFGTFYKIDLNWTFTTLASFDSSSASPRGDLIYADGVFYGLTSHGGANGSGTFFNATLDGTITVISSLPANAGSAFRLKQSLDGNFYYLGGDGLFSISKQGQIAELASFDSSGITNPRGVSQATDGQFYGVGKDSNGSTGVIFRVDRFGGVAVQSLEEMGDIVLNSLIQASDGHLYGSASGGVTQTGFIFRLDIGQGTQPVAISGVSRTSDGAFQLDGSAVPGASYRIESADNPGEPFVQMGMTTADSAGRFSFEDVNAAGVSRRLYRLAFP